MGQVISPFHWRETRIPHSFTCRSVHNIRIERLWRDLTAALGAKWKLFFRSLEAHDGLSPDQPAHIWLLHHLYLEAINDEVSQWAEAWNSHVVSI